MTSYVFDGTEVTKTGRRARRTVAVPRGERSFEMIEITPLDPDLEWKKWVRQEDLYEIMDDTKPD